MRGALTTFACAGFASGTLMTSMRKSCEFGFVVGPQILAAGQLARITNARRPGDVDVDVVFVVRIDEDACACAIHGTSARR